MRKRRHAGTSTSWFPKGCQTVFRFLVLFSCDVLACGGCLKPLSTTKSRSCFPHCGRHGLCQGHFAVQQNTTSPLDSLLHEVPAKPPFQLLELNCLDTYVPNIRSVYKRRRAPNPYTVEVCLKAARAPPCHNLVMRSAETT